MDKLQTYPWDAAEHLETKEDIAAYLEAALEDGDPTLVVAALEHRFSIQNRLPIWDVGNSQKPRFR